MNNRLKKLVSKPHVLIVDDDTRIRDLVSRYLYEHGFVVMAAADAFEAEKALNHFLFDVLIVDVMMPGKTGIEFTKEIVDKVQTPVVLLTALSEAEDRIIGLESGADDYLAKPFEPRELVLRLEAIIRRTSRPLDTDQTYKIGHWIFDPLHMELREEGGESLRMSTAEVTLINALLDGAGEVVSRDDLAHTCGVDPDTRTIDVQIARLRRKLEKDTRHPRYLQTVRGKGYRLRAEII